MDNILNGFGDILFALTGGVPLIDTLWLFPYIIVFLLITYLLVLFIMSLIPKLGSEIAFIVLLIPVFMLSIVSPLRQYENMKECETVLATLATDRISMTETKVIQCHAKDNFYNDFGAWYIADIPRNRN